MHCIAEEKVNSGLEINHRILISVITINLNNLEGLCNTVSSVLSQDFHSFEYIVIDGESTDGSVAYLASLSDKIQHLIIEKDNGIYDAMNKGIQSANGEYLLFLNSGDFFYSDNSLKSLADAREDAEIVYGNMMVENKGHLRIQHYPAKLNTFYFLFDTLPHPSSIIRKDLFSRFGMYNTNFTIVSDWAFFIDAIIGGRVVYKYVDRTISVFNLNGISSQAGSYRVVRNEMNNYLSAHYPIGYLYYKCLWVIKYYPKRILQKLGLISEQ
jgi:glycosyltransferase involved in cell wall biosynthesis